MAQEPVLWARHSCQQFHPVCNDDIQSLIDATEAVDDWPSLFRLNCGEVEAPNRWPTPERPTLDPWVVVGEGHSAGSTQVMMERIPLVWQVDTAGNQLPCVDKLQWGVSQGSQAILLEAIGGSIDMQARRISNRANKPVLSENAERSGYKLFERVAAHSNILVIHLNQTHKDPVMRACIRNKDVRIALSLWMDRDELIDIVWQGQGEPWQIGPSKLHLLYNEQLGNQNPEYDPDRVNELLDAAGYTEMNGDGIRLFPNGEPIVFNVNYAGVEQPEWGDAPEIIRERWSEIGGGVNSSGVERSIYDSHGEANEHDFMVWGAPGGLDPTLSPRDVRAEHLRQAGSPSRGRVGTCPVARKARSFAKVCCLIRGSAMSDATETSLTVDTGHAGADVAIASQWQLTCWAFKKHKLAMVGLWIIAFLYLISISAEFVAPDNPSKQNRRAVYHPPQMIHFIDRTEDGTRIRPYVWKMDRQRDPDALAISDVTSSDKIYLTMVGRGPEYKWWGMWKTDIHLFATEKSRDKFLIFGADRLGPHHFYSRTDALWLVNKLAELDFSWMEEPMEEAPISSYKWLTRNTALNILGPETMTGKHWTRAEWVKHDACDLVRAGVWDLGGINPAMKIAYMAECFHMSTEIRGTGAANLAVANLAVANLAVTCGIPNTRYYERGLLHPFIDYDTPKEDQNRIDDEMDAEGYVHARPDTGLGQDLNMDYIEANLV